MALVDVPAAGVGVVGGQRLGGLEEHPRAVGGRAEPVDGDLGVGAGGSTLEAGLRLNYRVSPQFSPYIGYVWEKTYGRTGDWLRGEGEHDEEGAWVVGLKFWL